MRVVSKNEHVQVVCVYESGNGGACHHYQILPVSATTPKTDIWISEETYGFVDFQNGPIKERGANGCQIEDLLEIVADRLQAFQEGPFPCRENAEALMHVNQARCALENRTANRKARGVEGENKA